MLLSYDSNGKAIKADSHGLQILILGVQEDDVPMVGNLEKVHC